MEIGKQIRKHRQDLKLSQDELAEKIFVTRQTISNWENDKNYPDIKSLLLLSSLFDISLDILVKGDLEEMKEQIKTEDIKRFNKDGSIFTLLLLSEILLAVPLASFWGLWGLGVWAIVYIITMFYAIRLEKFKKNHDIQTFKEIIAFSEGKTLNEIQKNQESGKKPYQKLLMVIGVCLFALIIGIVELVIILYLK
ncbi:MAG: helix-turn-helix transcriptional regulator [Lachnospiraceae bacterium]|nr:helix-turn-helix transcriptional regulator [Lachnospiraceae bacterium]